MKYIEYLKSAMDLLATNPDVIFLGQAVKYKGTGLTCTFSDIADKQKLELPVAEEMQLGITLGLSLKGFIPVSVYPRWNFLILAANQLVNHIDKWEQLTGNPPHLIIRVSVGSKTPLDPGPMHDGDFTAAFKAICNNINFVELQNKLDILPAYQRVFRDKQPHLLVEYADKYND